MNKSILSYCTHTRIVNKETRNLIMGFGIIVIILGGAYAALFAVTGIAMPFSSVVSESMQHDNDRSEIGAIDTGDIVIIKDPSKADIQSYVMGYHTGYKSFGEYGSVIIYDRGENVNPVIHRAILWLDYNPTNDTWSSKELLNFSGNWEYQYYENGKLRVNNNDVNNIRGKLILKDIGGRETVSVDLDNLPKKNSGFLTMGDNVVSNHTFDQSSPGRIVDHLIPLEDIRSVALMEIPWLGIPKLIMKGNDNLDRVPNSLPSLIMGTIVMFSIIIIIDSISIYRFQSGTERSMRSIEKWKRD